MPGWLGKQATSYVGANSQFFLFFLFEFSDSESDCFSYTLRVFLFYLLEPLHGQERNILIDGELMGQKREEGYHGLGREYHYYLSLPCLLYPYR